MTLFDQRCLIFIKLFADCWLQVDDEIGAGAGAEAEARRVFHFVISYIFLNEDFPPISLMFVSGYLMVSSCFQP